jgi:hypothetical protein
MKAAVVCFEYRNGNKLMAALIGTGPRQSGAKISYGPSLVPGVRDQLKLYYIFQIYYI